MKIEFRNVKLSKANKLRLDQINSIIEEYQEQGYRLTLRQLYYQLVSRDFVPNSQKEYKKLSHLLKEGRMGGVVDWEAIEDRLRVPAVPSGWDSPADILETAYYSYATRRMSGQDVHIEVWVEKDALSGVLSRVTEKYHIPILVNRGYSSASAMFDAYERFNRALETKSQVTILYLGDFDPSGQDMIRDISDRIKEFFGEENEHLFDLFEIVPIALTMEQIRQYNPPPNPAKIEDPRAKDYIKKNGGTSWEVDALRPEVLNQVLEDEIISRIDFDLYENQLTKERAEKMTLRGMIDTFK